MNKVQGWFYCFLVFRVASPTPSPSGPVLLCCPGEVQESLSWALQLVRDRDSNLALMTLGPAFQTTTGELGWEHFFFAHMAEEGWDQISQEVQDPLFRVPQLIRGREGGSAPLLAPGGMGTRRLSFPCSHDHMAGKGAWLTFPFSCLQDWLTCIPVNRVSSTALPRQGAGPLF